MTVKILFHLFELVLNYFAPSIPLFENIKGLFLFDFFGGLGKCINHTSLFSLTPSRQSYPKGHPFSQVIGRFYSSPVGVNNL